MNKDVLKGTLIALVIVAIAALIYDEWVTRSMARGAYNWIVTGVASGRLPADWGPPKLASPTPTPVPTIPPATPLPSAPPAKR